MHSACRASHEAVGREEGDVDQKHQIFPPRSSFRIALARADAPTPKYPATPAIEISISGFKRKVNISIDGFEQRPLLHSTRPFAWPPSQSSAQIWALKLSLFPKAIFPLTTWEHKSILGIVTPIWP